MTLNRILQSEIKNFSGIKYVIDTGRHKEKLYSSITGVSRYEVTWISQAAADQRAGRAGRTGPGRCYRLYSSAVFQDFPQFPPPEISQRPLDDLVLGMKSFGIDQISNFPFVSPPDSSMLVNAERLCVKLGALNPSNERKKISSSITGLGRTIATFPVSPRFGRILSLSAQERVFYRFFFIFKYFTEFLQSLCQQNFSNSNPVPSWPGLPTG